MSVRTEENKAEFTEAARVATAFKYAANRYVAKLNPQGKLTGKMLEVVQADTTNVRGERIFVATNAPKLKNFNVGQYSIQSLVYNPFSAKLVDVAGDTKATLNFGLPLIPATDTKKPQGATHVEISTVLIAVDFSNADNLPIVSEQR